jgi:hypothetical protein
LITTYQIRNVLRVYSNELKRRSSLSQNGLDVPHQSTDFVEISIDARQRQMLSKMSDNLISQITNKSPQLKTYEHNSRYSPSQKLGEDLAMG